MPPRTLTPPQKQQLLKQVQSLTDVNKLVQLLQTYTNLEITDFRGVIDPNTYAQLEEAGRDPQERSLAELIQSINADVPVNALSLDQLRSAEADITKALANINSYLSAYPRGPKAAEVSNMQVRLQDSLHKVKTEISKAEIRERERADWDALDKNNPHALVGYLSKYPQTVHLEEIDDFYWSITNGYPSSESANDYLQKFPTGRHASEARDVISCSMEWNNVKYSHDIFEVNNFYQRYQSSPIRFQILERLDKLRNEMLEEMAVNPGSTSLDDLERIISSGVFSLDQLIDRGLMTYESYERLRANERQYLPNIRAIMENAELPESRDGSTDVFFFGIPGTGKTCLIMGLAGSDGNGYTVDTFSAGGEYAGALAQYVRSGITPESTNGGFVSMIYSDIKHEYKKGKVAVHHVNYVEMAGEDFAKQLVLNADNSVCFEDMGHGTTELLKNKNRKVFFIILDPTTMRVKTRYTDENGDVRIAWLDQPTILNKFISMFTAPMNAELMKRVDAIHFIVTKADSLADNFKEREEKAVEKLRSQEYAGAVTKLKEYCRATKRINASTKYNVKVLPFSLGQFYLGDIFDYRHDSTLQFIDLLKAVTGLDREKSFWEKLKENLD